MGKQENLNKMKTGELAQRAKKAGVKDVQNMNKQQMIQAIGGGGQPESRKPSRGGGRGDRPAPAGTKPQEWKNVPGNQS